MRMSCRQASIVVGVKKSSSDRDVKERVLLRFAGRATSCQVGRRRKEASALEGVY